MDDRYALLHLAPIGALQRELGWLGRFVSEGDVHVSATLAVGLRDNIDDRTDLVAVVVFETPGSGPVVLERHVADAVEVGSARCSNEIAEIAEVLDSAVPRVLLLLLEAVTAQVPRTAPLARSWVRQPTTVTRQPSACSAASRRGDEAER